MWDTIHDWAEDNRDALLTLAALALLAAGAALGQGAEPRARDEPLRPVIVIATPTRAAAVAQVAPTATAPVLTRAIVAYDAPGGAVLGAIEPGRAYTVVARSGAAWLLLDVVGSGAVWARASEVAPELADAPDLATPVPPPAPQIVVVSAPPAEDAPVAASVAPAPGPTTTPDWPAPGPHSTGGTCLDQPGECRVDLTP
ncbi:MAG: hypothetical protein RLZZ387_2452 [Chloroflexota bacterium]|jgi:hypothetical protein